MWQLNTLMFFSVLYIGMSQAHAAGQAVPSANDPGYVSVSAVNRSSQPTTAVVLRTNEQHGGHADTAKPQPVDNRILGNIF